MTARDSGLRLDALSPWPGLAAYDETAQAFFHGREEETAELQLLVSLSPLTTLYGRSGLGKSSLLQAGLFPRLRAEACLPVYVRIDFSREAETPPMAQIASRLKEETARNGVDITPLAAGHDLWEWLHSADFELWSADNRLLTPVLVLDQFEELFSRGGDDAARLRAHFAALADLIENRIPPALEGDRARAAGLDLLNRRYRVILSFREDFLPDFEAWKDQLPSLLRNRLRLLAMSREQAVAAIERAGAAVLAPGVAPRIVDFVTRPDGDGTRGTAVEPVLLSLCCSQLNGRRAPDRPIDSELIAQAGENILDDFYREALVGLDTRVARFIETHLVQGDRYRGSYPRDEALASGALTAAELARLTDRYRLLRVDQQADTARVELIHDRLVAVVRQARDRRLAEEQAAAERRAREEAERLAQEETERRISAEAAQLRMRRMRNGMAALSVVMVCAVAFAYVQYDHASRNAQLADQNAQAAAKNELIAKNSARDASAAEALAKGSADAERQQRALARGRELIALSLQQMDGDTELSMLLAAEAVRAAEITDTVARLKEAVEGMHTLARYQAAAAFTRIAVLGDGRIALGARNGAVHVWSPAPRGRAVLLRDLGAPLDDLVAGSDGKQLFAWSIGAGEKPRSVIVSWDARTLERRWRVELGRVDSVHVSPCCARLLVESGDQVTLLDAANGQTIARNEIDINFGAGFAEGGKTFLAAGNWRPPDAPIFGSSGWQISRFGADDGKRLDTVELRSSAGSVIVDPFGRDLLSGSVGSAENGNSQYLETPIWMLMPEKRTFSLVGSVGGRVGSPQFHPRDRRTVAFAGRNVVQEWHMRNGGEPGPVLWTQRPHLGQVVALAYDKGGELLLSADDTDTLRIWRSGNESQSTGLLYARGHRIAHVRFTADGRIVTAGGDGSARLWQVPGLGVDEQMEPVCKACKSAADWLALAERKRTRELTPDERKRYGFDAPVS